MCNGVKCACQTCENNKKNNPKGQCNGCKDCNKPMSENKQKCIVFGI